MSLESGCFIALGIAFLFVRILYRVGQLRTYYWLQPFGYYRVGVYMLIPLGVAVTIIGIGPLFYDTFGIVILRIVVIFLGLLCVFIIFFQPRFAKPDWINWLEDHYAPIIPELRREICRMSNQERKKIINDQTALEAWIEERRHRGY